MRVAFNVQRGLAEGSCQTAPHHVRPVDKEIRVYLVRAMENRSMEPGTVGVTTSQVGPSGVEAAKYAVSTRCCGLERREVMHLCTKKDVWSM